MANEQDRELDTDASGEINIESLDGEELVELLIEQPQLADKCDWSKLGGDDWASLLKEQPQLAKYRPADK